MTSPATSDRLQFAILTYDIMSFFSQTAWPKITKFGARHWNTLCHHHAKNDVIIFFRSAAVAILKNCILQFLRFSFAVSIYDLNSTSVRWKETVYQEGLKRRSGDDTQQVRSLRRTACSPPGGELLCKIQLGRVAQERLDIESSNFVQRSRPLFSRHFIIFSI